jgi:type VI secretion system FHA domain protein
MATQVTLTCQSTGGALEKGEPIRLVEQSLTIGRSDENDLVLPDPDRMLSKRHCKIEDDNGNIVVVDQSTNGTFLNYAKLALGDTQTPLNDGDILSIGPYELLVSIVVDTAGSNAIAEPLDVEPIFQGSSMDATLDEDPLAASEDGSDFLDDLLGGRDEPIGPSSIERQHEEGHEILSPLSDEDNIIPDTTDLYAGQGASTPEHTPSVQDNLIMPSVQLPEIGSIPDDWNDDLLSSSGSGPSNPFGGSSKPTTASNMMLIPDDLDGDPDIPNANIEVPSAPAPAAKQPLRPSLGPDIIEEQGESAPENDAAAREFLKALGADEIALTDTELVPAMFRMGDAMRLMIEGMREILMTRTSIKSEFRIEQTMIKVGGNNPLKFSISPEQAIEAMVKPSAKGYLEAEDAVKEALKDIKAHEIAMVTGMEAALKGILAKLDPAVLEEKISSNSGFGNVLKSKKARYWEVYESMYAQISDQAENDFHEFFAREFALAYQEQLDKISEE